MSITAPRTTSCVYFPTCNACQLWDLGYSAQKDLKTSRLKELLHSHGLNYIGPVTFVSSAEYGLRDRIDFTFMYKPDADKVIYGFYDRDKNLISIKNCLQMSSYLQKIYDEFTSIDPKFGEQWVSKGSVRLRRGIDGLKGCWLDLANLDIKCLLEDGNYLRKLLNHGFKVEVGQKGKSVTEVDGVLKLTAPVPYPWFKTFAADGSEVSLKCLISDFTQPSWQSARDLVKIVLSWVLNIQNPGLSVVEFGPGIGQLTLPLLSAGVQVSALEVNAAACENLRINAEAGGYHSLKIVNDDFQRKNFAIEAGVIVVNPARSGLKNFTASIENSKAEYLIYVSCFPESMCEDLEVLRNSFQIKEIKILDQFPQTNHFESCVLLERIK